jgi:hypothetical protein
VRCGAGNGQPLLAPPFKVGGGRIARPFSPVLLRIGAAAARSTLRVDIHPDDLDHTSHMLALERVLQGSRGRVALTYEDLAH